MQEIRDAGINLSEKAKIREFCKNRNFVLVRFYLRSEQSARELTEGFIAQNVKATIVAERNVCEALLSRDIKYWKLALELGNTMEQFLCGLATLIDMDLDDPK